MTMRATLIAAATTLALSGQARATDINRLPLSMTTGPLPAAQLPAFAGGDCISTAGSVSLTCTKTGGVLFAPSATTDTTNPANITNTQTGTGTLARSLAARSHDVISAADYTGVDPTGSTESTVGLTQAIADTASRGVGLVFPCGTYIADNVPIPSGSFMIPAQRGCVTIQRKAGASGRYVMSATNVHGFIIQGLSIDANSAGNAGNAGSGLHVSGSYQYSIRDIQTSRALSTDGGNYGVGLQIDGCADAAHGTSSDVTGSTFIGGAPTTLTGLLVQKCQNLTIDGNTAYGNLYGGIAVVDQSLPISTVATNSNITIVRNHTYGNGIGIDVAGFTAGPGIGGASIASMSNFVNQYVTVADNETYGNVSYGALIQAADLVMSGNKITANGTGTVYGGAAVGATRFSISGNIVNGNSYYGLDIGGSSHGVVSGNTIRQNGKGIGQAIGLNLGALIDVTVGVNDVGDNGGASGGAEVLGSAVDGSGAGNFFPWVGSGLTIDGLKIAPSNAAMTGLKLANSWSIVSVTNTTVNNIVGSAHPFDIFVGSGSLHMGGNKVLDNTGSWTPTIASASTIVVPDSADAAFITGTATINSIYGSAQNALLGGMREFVPSNTGNGGYTAGATASCTATGGTAATVTPARSANGNIYGLYVNTPGTGASAMSCTAADQSCSATPGAVTVSGGSVAAIAAGSGGSGCANPPKVTLAGLTCTTPPIIHATVSSGAVNGYVIDYGGQGCTGTGTASILNGSGFAGTAYIGAGQNDKSLDLRFNGAAVVKNGTGNVLLGGGDYTASANGSLGLRAAFGNFYGTYRQ